MAPAAVGTMAEVANGESLVTEPQNVPPPRSQPSHEEYQYLDLIRDILDFGEHRPDRYLYSTSSML